MSFNIIRDRQTHQAHVVMGCEVMGGKSDERFALSLITNMLGGPAMSARLNQSLREKTGLVYTVEANLGLYPDRGLWTVYFGCDVEDVERCQQLVKREIQKFTDKPLSEKALKAAVKQYCGQMLIAEQNVENHILAVAKSYAYYNEKRDVNVLIRRLKSLTSAEIQTVARKYLKVEGLSVLVYR